MLRSLNTAVSGMRQFQDEMDVIGNNIANVNTNGYKAARVQFADTFSQTLRAASPAFGSNSSIPSMQIGSGVAVSNIQNLNTQGAITRTGVDTDMAVSGSGYFVVRDTVSGANYATRAGDFRTDGNGYLVTPSGQRLQGYSDSALTTVGDLKVDADGKVDSKNNPLTVSSFNFSDDGRLTVHLSDGSSFIRGRVLLQNFKDPAALVKQGGNLYSGLDVAGQLDWSTGAGVPSATGAGTIQAGSLELSNVDLANEFTTLITTQRAYQANARMITTSDELLQEIVNLKR